jgi:hypothetical protein
MAKSVAQERKLTVYPDTKYHRLVVAESVVNGVSKSEQVNRALKFYYDNLSDQEQRDIIERSKNPLFKV